MHWRARRIEGLLSAASGDDVGLSGGRRSADDGWLMSAATGMLAVIKATLRTLSRPMSGSASISPTSASPKQVDDAGGDRDAHGDQGHPADALPAPSAPRVRATRTQPGP